MDSYRTTQFLVFSSSSILIVSSGSSVSTSASLDSSALVATSTTSFTTTSDCKDLILYDFKNILFWATLTYSTSITCYKDDRV